MKGLRAYIETQASVPGLVSACVSRVIHLFDQMALKMSDVPWLI